MEIRLTEITKTMHKFPRFDLHPELNLRNFYLKKNYVPCLGPRYLSTLKPQLTVFTDPN